MIPLVHREDVEMDKGKKVSEVCQNLLHPADLRSLASALSTFNEKSSKTVGLGHDGNHLNNEHKQMAKFQRYAGYEHQTPEPVIPKPDVLPDPRVVTVQDGLPILFEPCESPAVRVVHPTNPKAPSKNFSVTMLYVPPQGTVALASHEPEEVYAVLEGAGTMHFTKGPQAIKKGDFIYLPAWCEHSIDNTGVEQMVVMVITSPPNP